MDLSYLADGFIFLLFSATGLYVLLRLLFWRSIISFTDPLNLAALLLAFYFSGALFILRVTTVNRSYAEVIGLNVLFLVVAAAFSRRPRPREPLHLHGKPAFHLIFALFFSLLLLANLVINQIFGVIPLFLGTETRGTLGTTTFPSLVLLAPDVTIVLLLIFLLTKSRAVKLVSGIGFMIGSISALLSGSKSAIITTTLLALFSADFIFRIRLLAEQPDSVRRVEQKRIKRTRWWMVAAACALLLLLPIYLVFIGADAGGGGSSTALELFATRLFGGFDNLAFIAFDNLDITSVKDVNVFQFYFYPFFKKLAFTPVFQSAGEYLVYMSSGSYEAATSGLNPNSNFAIELLLHNGSVILSGVIVMVTAAVLFIIRQLLLSKDSLRILQIVLWTNFVMAPLALLFDGAYFFIKFYALMGFYVGLNTLVNLYKWLQGNRVTYVFY
jgi:hypothetical protein